MKAARKNNHPQCTISKRRCQAVLKGEITVIELKIEPDGPGKSKCRCGIEGDLKTLTLNTIEAIHSIYRAMAEDGGPSEALELFKIRVAMAVGDPRSPVWDLTDDPI